MYGSVFNIRNNSDTDQELNLFDSSDQSGGGSTKTVWFFSADFASGANAVYNTGTELWYDQAVVANPGAISIRYFESDGTSRIITFDGVPTKAEDLTTAQLIDAFNNDTDFGQLGTWSIETPVTRTGVFTISLDIDETFARGADIAIDDKSLNYGAESIDFAGTGWTAVVALSTASTGPSLRANPNVSISSYSDFDYNQFLYSVVQRTYDVKNFQIWSPNQNQLLEPFLFDRKTAAGKKFQKVLTPIVDPYQDQNYVVTPEDKGYILDGFTKIKYKVLARSQVRLILDYTFIDSSTPLVAKLQGPQLNKDLISPVFVSNMENGYVKFGCSFLLNRSKVLSDKLRDVAGPDGTKSPKWQQQIKQKLLYIKQMMTMYECFPKERIENLPEFEMVGTEYRRKNLWMPSTEFVQAQLDSEQGARKLFDKFDFPIVKE